MGGKHPKVADHKCEGYQNKRGKQHAFFCNTLILSTEQPGIDIRADQKCGRIGQHKHKEVHGMKPFVKRKIQLWRSCWSDGHPKKQVEGNCHDAQNDDKRLYQICFDDRYLSADSGIKNKDESDAPDRKLVRKSKEAVQYLGSPDDLSGNYTNPGYRNDK